MKKRRAFLRAGTVMLLICGCCGFMAGCKEKDSSMQRQEAVQRQEMLMTEYWHSQRENNPEIMLELSEALIKIDGNFYYVYGDCESDIYVAARLIPAAGKVHGMVEYRIYYKGLQTALTVLPLNPDPNIIVGRSTVYYVDINTDGYKDLIIVENGVGNDGEEGGKYYWSYCYAYDIQNVCSIDIADRCGGMSENLIGAYMSALTDKQLDSTLRFKLSKTDNWYKKYADKLVFNSKTAGAAHIDEDGSVYFYQCHNCPQEDYTGGWFYTGLKTIYNKDTDTFDAVHMTVYKSSQNIYFEME